jgi:hypothetical protein
MTPEQIRACYRLYAAHRRSHEICTFPEIIPVTNNAGDPDDLAVGDPNDHLGLSAVGHVGHLRKTLASFAAQLFGRDALVGR